MAMKGARWVTAGVVDQVVMASANAAMTLLPLGLWGKSATAGTLVLTIGLGYLVLALSREFVGNVLLTQAARLSGEPRERLVRHGLAAAATVGCAAAVVFLAVWAFYRHPSSKIDMSYLIFLAPFLPVVLVHDAGRYAYLSDREPASALVIDLVWVGTQAAVIAAMLASGHRSPGLLLASWGLGACAGATTFLLRTGARPWRGDPRQWLAETKHISGWFTATAVVAQIQVQAIGFLVTGRLSKGDLAVLRSGQSALLQPVQNFVIAMMGLLVPRASRLAGEHDRTGLRRQTVRIAAVFALLGAVMVAVVVPLAHALRPHLGRYEVIVPLSLPISIQAAIYLLQVPFTAAMRGMQLARRLFAQYVIFACTSLTGLVIGSAHGLRPATWGLCIGSAVGLVVMISLYVWSAARMPDAPADLAPPEEPASTKTASPASR
jgi:O-antigen/teichoic acid export membrane protein